MLRAERIKFELKREDIDTVGGRGSLFSSDFGCGIDDFAEIGLSFLTLAAAYAT